MVPWLRLRNVLLAYLAVAVGIAALTVVYAEDNSSARTVLHFRQGSLPQARAAVPFTVALPADAGPPQHVVFSPSSWLGRGGLVGMTFSYQGVAVQVDEQPPLDSAGKPFVLPGRGLTWERLDEGGTEILMASDLGAVEQVVWVQHGVQIGVTYATGIHPDRAEALAFQGSFH